MTTVNYANVILKDASGNIGVVRTLTAADVSKVQQVKTDVALIVDATTHQLITANQTTFGATRIATAAELAAGTANIAVDAAAYKALADKMVSGVHYKGTVPSYENLPTTDVEAGDMYNVTAPFSKDGIDYPGGTNVIADTSGATGSSSYDCHADRCCHPCRRHLHRDRHRDYTSRGADASTRARLCPNGSKSSHSLQSCFQPYVALLNCFFLARVPVVCDSPVASSCPESL